MNRAPVCYEYDGTFSGFLTCVFESYAYREEPVCFLSPGDGRTTLWDTRRVDADQALARRVWRGIRQNISPGARAAGQPGLSHLSGGAGDSYLALSGVRISPRQLCDSRPGGRPGGRAAPGGAAPWRGGP